MFEKKNLLSSQARVQVPWIKVKIGTYEFGVFSKSKINVTNEQGFYQAYNLKYPNYIQSLSIIKINGQVNQYTLDIRYPIRAEDDPNFFEKIFSSVSNTRKIVFSYGDASMPNYIYKDEEAIITKVTQRFDLVGSAIAYTVTATSSAALSLGGAYTFINSGLKKPSDEIKNLFKNKNYNLQTLFPGMNAKNINYLIEGGDKKVLLSSKENISIIDYINYLVGCMVPESSTTSNISSDIYILTLHDDTTFDDVFGTRDNVQGEEIHGAYFKVTKTTYLKEQSDAYEIDVGYNTATIVTGFSIENQDNYSLYFDYQQQLDNTEYVSRIGADGLWETIYSPSISSKNDKHITRPEDVSWWTKVTKYPISATITIQGLLRPATLMQYVRLNVIFPGGHKHMSSGLYIITQQQDVIDFSGYKTTLKLTKISGDNSPTQ